MKVWGVTREQVDAAMAQANGFYAGNIRYSDYGEPRQDGRALRFTIRVVSSKGPGHRLSSGNLGAKRRRLPAACWHVHRDVMRALFSLGATRIRTGIADYRPETFESAKWTSFERNAGSMMYPVRYGDLCECTGTDGHMVTFGTLTESGLLTSVRLIRQSDILRCPHVIVAPEHYRQDGSCRCDDPTHREMAKWGYTLEDGRWVS